MAREKEVNVIVDAKNKSKRSFLEVKRDLRDLDREAQRGTASFSRSFAKADKVVLSFSNRLQFMDKIAKRTFQGTAAAASVYVATTLRDFSQLENGISKVNTLYDQTRQSQDKMLKDSLNMYRLLPTDFENITQGIYDSISAGVDSKYAGITSRKFGQASVAGMTELPVVTKAAMGTMNAFKKEIKDLNHILDVQFLTVKNGIVEYDQLASALGTGVLSSAESAGVGMEELYASIAQITKNAIPANIATTSLIQLFNKFTDTKALKEFKEFGVNIRNSKGETRDLVEIFKDLNEQFDKRGYNKEQRAGYLKELLGSDEAVRALQPLLGGLKDFEKVLNEMENSSGAMQDAFEDRLDNINTQAKLMWNNFKAYGVEQILTLKPFFDALMGPTLEKQKLTFRKMDLEDYLEFEKDPQKRKMARMEIEDIQRQIDQIDLTPVEKFRDALNESTEKLKEINPLLADIIETIGNFLLNFTGEEGKENREKAMSWGKKIFGIWALKKIGDAYLWGRNLLGYGTATGAGSAGGTTLASKGLRTLSKLGVNSAIATEATAGAAAGVIMYGTFKGAKWASDKLEPYDPTFQANKKAKERGNVQRLEELREKYKYNEDFDILKMQKIIDVMTGLSAGDKISRKHLQILNDALYDEISKNMANGSKNLLNTGEKNVTEYIVDKMLKIQKNIPALSDVDYSRMLKAEIEDREIRTPEFKQEILNEINKIKAGAFAINFLDIPKQKENIERQINFKNDVVVEPPKVDVKVFVDGKQVPARFDYDSIRKAVSKDLLMQSRRYGKD